MIKIYGRSDDLIEIEGDIRGEINCYDRDILLICSDGTLLKVRYGKVGKGIWDIQYIEQGYLCACSIDICTDEDSDIYSDVCYLKDGIKWIYYAFGEFDKI